MQRICHGVDIGMRGCIFLALFVGSSGNHGYHNVVKNFKEFLT